MFVAYLQSRFSASKSLVILQFVLTRLVLEAAFQFMILDFLAQD